jgi:hypothetical protein
MYHVINVYGAQMRQNRINNLLSSVVILGQGTSECEGARGQEIHTQFWF